MGLLVGVLSMYLYARAIALLGSVRASVFVALFPVVTALMSPAILAEWPTAPEITGMVVVILGVVLSLRLNRDEASTVSGELGPYQESRLRP